MGSRNLFVFTIAALMAAGTGPALAGDTVTYRGTGTYKAARSLLPLAHGGAAVHVSNSIVATIEPSDSGFLDGDCAGLGYLGTAGEYSVITYCTFTEMGGDSFDIRATIDEGKGSVDVIGGSGKWEGATGTGSVAGRYAEGGSGTYEYEFAITTP